MARQGSSVVRALLYMSNPIGIGHEAFVNRRTRFRKLLREFNEETTP